MRFGIVVLFGSFQFGASPERGQGEDRWLGRDKAYHVAASATIQALAHGLVRGGGADYRTASGVAGVTTLVIGVGKEVHDRADGRVFSWRDLVADATGGATAAVVVRQVDR